MLRFVFIFLKRISTFILEKNIIKWILTNNIPTFKSKKTITQL